MKTVTKVMLLCVLTFTQRVCATDVDVTLRVRPSEEGFSMIGLIVNNSGAKLVFSDPTRGFAWFRVVKLHDPSRQTYSSSNRPTSFHDPMATVLPKESQLFDIPIKDIAPKYEFIEKEYWFMAWRAASRTANFICVGFADKDGNIQSPVVNPNNANVEMYVGFVYQEAKAPDVFFLFLNGRNEAATIEKPLTQASRIVATAPAIEYTRELYIAGQPSESIAIETGKVGEWRLPWKTVYELIPEADLAKIKEAGGELDLVWKVGDYESPPLPISLGTINVE